MREGTMSGNSGDQPLALAYGCRSTYRHWTWGDLWFPSETTQKGAQLFENAHVHFGAMNPSDLSKVASLFTAEFILWSSFGGGLWLPFLWGTEEQVGTCVTECWRLGKELDVVPPRP